MNKYNDGIKSRLNSGSTCNHSEYRYRAFQKKVIKISGLLEEEVTG
jgi:hypothetical protein